MNVYLNAYFDNNLGDDLMIKGILEEFKNYNFYAETTSSVIKNSFKNYENLHFIDPKEKGIYSKIDIYMNLGGSVFQFNKIMSYYSYIKRYTKLSRAKRRGAFTCTLGSNLGPFSLPFSKWLFKKETKKYDLITVRDAESYLFLQKECNYKKSYHYDDIVFELMSNFEKNNVEDRKISKRNVLGITAYRSLNKCEYNDQYNRGIATIVNRVLDENLADEIKVFAFDTERENDLSSAHHILNYIGSSHKTKVTIIPYMGDVDYFLTEFKSCSLQISTRFHSHILARYFLIKSIPVFYSNKMVNYSKDKNIEKFLIDFENINERNEIDRIIRYIANPSELIKTVEYDIKVGHLRKLKQYLDKRNE